MPFKLITHLGQKRWQRKSPCWD